MIRGGTVVNSDWSGPADLGIRDGRIAAVLAPGTPADSAERVVDAGGMLLLPGGVDPHCHVGFTSGEFTSLDTYLEATKAAVLGGTTTIIDFAIPRPGQSPWEAIVERQALASEALCDSALHACVVEWDDTVPAQLAKAADIGIMTVKMFTTYRGEVMANEDTILKVMKTLKELGGMAVVHAEANHIIEDTQLELAAAQMISACHHHLSRTELSETASVAEILAIAEALDTPVYFVHQSSAEAVELVNRARMRGVRAFSEVVAHHVTLDDSEYSGANPERFVCCPPLRPRETVEGLRDTVHRGLIDTLASDHCCYDTAQKEKTPGDVRIMPNGLPGVETRMPVLFDQLVHQGGMSVQKLVALSATNPARLNGLYPRKGVIAVGSDADIAVWDPALTRTVRTAELHMTTDYTPYEGREVTGWPVTVIVNGHVVVENGSLTNGDTTIGRSIQSAPVDVTLY
ncbi:dihydropyrimidinase [Mycobacterium sp. MS1601]|nr:dihydropyrimidinase [Mycobacterium sp. MS1601]